MMMRRVYNALVVAVCLLVSATAASAENLPQEKWLYYPTNLLVKENVDKLEKVWREAASLGFTHVNLSDTKFCRLAQMPSNYFANAERVKKLATQLKLEIVPGVFPLGWSNALLAHDPNLAEGLPVRDALFVVHGGEARLLADPPVNLRGGDFADLKQWGWHDPEVTADDGAARIADCPGKNSRIVQTVKVSPFRQYHLSVRIKSQDFRGQPEVKVLAGDKLLNYNALDFKPTQDWTTFHTVFNSLNNREVGIYLGCWGGGRGSVWFDDASLEEVGLVNVLRRPGAPLVVRRDGKDGQPLVEGKDFEKVADPKLGNVPWEGEYEVWHEPPLIKTGLPDGTRLRVSYFHPMVIYGGSVMIALSEPKTLEILRDHARRVHELFDAKAYFMNHDEICILNWDQASVDRKLDAGPLLAANAKACTEIMRSLAPQARLYVWSDMFDPHHNAVKNYYLVRGDLAGSWLGLDKNVILVNWNFDKRDQSLKFFADRGHRQLIAGYYDADPREITKWLDAAGKVSGVLGVMYTTWQEDYAKLRPFVEAVEGYRAKQ